SGEFLGLPGAVLAAGAGLVVSTLWSIDMEAPVEIVRDVYTRLRTSTDPVGVAVMSAVRSLAHGQDPAPAPYLWVPFVVDGVDWTAAEVSSEAAAVRPIEIKPPLRLGRHLSRREVASVELRAKQLVDARRFRESIELLSDYRSHHEPVEGHD